jgi:hypothetical protein
MKNTATLLLLGATMWLLGPTRVLAETFKMPETKMSMEHCLQAALAKRAGEVEKLEFKLKDGTPVYEIEIVDRDDAEWEYECDANSGKIIGEEREVASAIVPTNRCGYIKIRVLSTYEVPLCVALKSMAN